MRSVRLISVTLLVLVVAATAVPAAPLAAMLEMLRAPVLAEDAHQVEALKIEVGNAEFELDGTVESLIAGGISAGFAFSGRGTIRVGLATGPFEQANRSTMKAAVGWKPSADEPYRRSFDEAVIFTLQAPDEVRSAEPSGTTSQAQLLAKALEWWGETDYAGLDHTLAFELLNDLGGTQLLALMWGGDGADLAYLYDDVYQHEERLVRWDKDTFDGRSLRYFEQLITQPAGTDPRRRPSSVVRQVDIDLDLVSPDNELLRERTTTEIEAGRDGVQVVGFSLLNGRSERFKRWDERDDPFVVASVRTADGVELEFSHRYDQLLVKMPHPLAAGEHLRLIVEAEGRLLKNYAGDSYLVLGNMAYFPSLDIYDVDAPFRSKVVVKEPFVPLATGKNIRRWSDEGLNGLETVEDRPIAFPFVIVGNFEQETRSEGGYDIKVYSYAMGKKRGAKALARNGLAILDYYSHGMEKFPYEELEVVEIPYFRHFFWQAPSGVVEITSEGLSPIAGDSSDLDTLIRRYASKGQNARYAHEIAHQWFGNLVSWGTPYDNWLSESFAEYLSYMFMSEGGNEKRKAKVQFHEWQVDTEECSDRSSIYGASALDGSTQNRRCYTQLLYGKGPYVLHALRHEMGDENFKKMLYFLTAQAAKKNLKVITEDVIQFANVLTKKDFRPFFEKYVYGTEVPVIEE